MSNTWAMVGSFERMKEITERPLISSFILSIEVRMHETPRSRLIAYSVAVLAPALSLLVRWPLWPVLGDAVPHMTFFPAVMIAAYFGGFGPGLLATILSAVAANLIPHQVPSLQATQINEVAALILFVLVGSIMSGLSESLHQARRRIMADERQRAEETLRE